MEIAEIIYTLRSAAIQWADYLEESKKYGYGNLETDLEIADIRKCLRQAQNFLESINEKDAEFEKWLEDYLDANADELYEKYQWDKGEGLL